MANTTTIAYEKSGRNFKTTVFNVALTGNYAAPEVVTLTSAASNPAARTVTGPNGASPLPPVIAALQVGGGANGYVPQLKATATPGQYNLTFVQGVTAFAGAYTAGDFVTIEVDHTLQGYN